MSMVLTLDALALAGNNSILVCRLQPFDNIALTIAALVQEMCKVEQIAIAMITHRAHPSYAARHTAQGLVF